MTAEGRERLGASGEFDAIVDSQITDLIHDDGEAEKLGEFVERLTDDGVHTAMVVIAPHGGLIEEYTDHQAERGLFDLDTTPIRQAINDVFRAVPIEVVFRPRDANDYFSFGGPGALLVSDRRRSCFGLPENIGQRELEELIMTKLCLKIFR